MTDLTADERAKVEEKAHACAAGGHQADVRAQYFIMGAEFLAQLRPHAPKGGVIADPKLFKFYGSADCKSCETGRVTLFVANDECMECNPESYQRKPSPKGGELPDPSVKSQITDQGVKEDDAKLRDSIAEQKFPKHRPPLDITTENARQLTMNIWKMGWDDRSAHQPATDARVGREECKHPGCCCVCGHQSECPECGPIATGGTFE